MPKTSKAKSKRATRRKATTRGNARKSRKSAKAGSARSVRRTRKFTVFIAWAGDKSRDIGEVVKGSLTTIIPRLELLYSPNLPAGVSWATRLQTWLRRADYAILCVTKEGLASPWMGFEAGASLKALTRATVCPLLFDAKPGDLSVSPLQIFQAREFNKPGFADLCNELGRKTRMKPQVVSDNRKNVWAGLEAEVKKILNSPP
jgi:hypothetical protein